MSDSRSSEPAAFVRSQVLAADRQRAADIPERDWADMAADTVQIPEKHRDPDTFEAAADNREAAAPEACNIPDILPGYAFFVFSSGDGRWFSARSIR